MSYKLTKTQEIAESIMDLAERTPLEQKAVETLLICNLKKHGIKCEILWSTLPNMFNDELEPCDMLCHIFEDDKHYYDLFFFFEKNDKDEFVLSYYDLDDTLETVEED